MVTRTPVRILLALAAAASVALALSVFGVIGADSAQAVRPGTPLPHTSLKVTKISPTEVSTGEGTAGPLFQWATGFGPLRPGAETRTHAPLKPGAESDPGVFCVSISNLGPFMKVPGGGVSTQETSSLECGPIGRKTGLVLTSPTRSGSLEQPEGQTETWQTFDLGVVVYLPSVEKVRLRFAGGGATVLSLRRMPAADRPKSWEPFRYVSFGVYGCVNEVEGLMGQKAVTRAYQTECGS